MKKLISIIFLLILFGFAGYFVNVNYLNDDDIVLEEEIANISEYYIYGDHFNIKGSLEIDDMNYSSICLTLYNDDEDTDIEIVYDIDGSIIDFYLSEYINDGLYLDDIARGNYYLFLKITYDNSEDAENPIIKYYALSNNTDYKETIYYTMSKYNNKIVINSNNKYSTMAFNIEMNKDDGVYDITIDPGHGGMDGGAPAGKNNESDYTMAVSVKLKEYLEAAGFKIKMTHDEGELTKNDFFDYYNEHGRAVIPNEVKSKYTFSIHFNQNDKKSINGIEVYTASDINYDLAKSIVNGMVENTELNYSNNRMYKIFNGVYTRNFTDSDIASSLKEYEEKGYVPYDLSNESNYYFMIRETGGFMTGAYIDDRNREKVGVNPYYNSNVGNESYLLELGYLSNSGDLTIIRENSFQIAKAVSDAIIQKFNK